MLRRRFETCTLAIHNGRTSVEDEQTTWLQRPTGLICLNGWFNRWSGAYPLISDVKYHGRDLFHEPPDNSTLH